jgi:hypothetical protein
MIEILITVTAQRSFGPRMFVQLICQCEDMAIKRLSSTSISLPPVCRLTKGFTAGSAQSEEAFPRFVNELITEDTSSWRF